MSRFHPLKVVDVRRETPDAVSIAFDVPERFKADYAYIPGQYLTLRTMRDGQEVRRSYSICSGLDDGELRVAVKRVEGGAFSTFANNGIAVGDEIEAMPPDGRFTVEPDANNARHFVAFAAGSGVTPIMSIVKSVLEREPNSRVTLIYGNRTVGDIIFREDLEDLKNRHHERFALVHVLSRESQDVELFNGRIDAEKCGELLDRLIDPEIVDAFLICGPGTMIEDVSGALRQRGVDRSRIRFELFTPADAPAEMRKEGGAARAAVEGTAHVTVIIDGVRTEFDMPYDGEAIVDAAIEAGADAPFSCKGGVCSTCRAKLLEGQVEMDENFALLDEEVEEGFILTCQSHPRTPTIVVDYDAV